MVVVKGEQKRLLFVVTGLRYGGAEGQLVLLARSFVERGWAVSVVTLLPAEGRAADLASSGIQVYALGLKRGAAVPTAIWRFVRFVRRFRPTVIISFMVHANLVSRLLRPLIRVPVLICSARNVEERGGHPSSTVREIAYRVTDFLCDLTVQNSRAGLRRYIEVGAVPQRKICYIPNGVDVHRFCPDSHARQQAREALGVHDHFVWLAVGRLEPPKDYPTLLKAFAIVAQRVPVRQVLLIAGVGSELEKLKRQATELGVDLLVRFLGLRHDIPNLMNAADAFVMSSAWEGMPNVLLEAGAVGLPVVATEVGGCPEVVPRDEGGFLVRARDHEALAVAMERMLLLPAERRREMGKVLRAHVVQRYALEKVVDQWESLCLALMRRRGLPLG